MLNRTDLKINNQGVEEKGKLKYVCIATAVQLLLLCCTLANHLFSCPVGGGIMS